MKTVNHRTTQYDISDIFLNRWSPRAISGQPISEKELMTLFDAARWAPSASNVQPWRFIYAQKDTPEFETFFNLLSEGNQEWCKNASALIVTISANNDKHGYNKTHSFDTGAAWENLALQGSFLGLVTHGMGGFDRDRAKTDLAVPDDYTVEMMIAVGKPGPLSVLSEKNLEREKPSQRKPLEEVVFKGTFKQQED